MKFFSLQNITDKLELCVRRFSVTIDLLLVLTAFLIAITNDFLDFSKKSTFFFIYYPATAAVLSLSLKLWSEEVKNKVLSIGVQAVIHMAWLASALYFTTFVPFHINMPVVTMMVALNVAVVLSVWLLPFLKSRTDRPLWNFMLRTAAGLAVSAGIGLALSLALLFLVKSLEMLFGLTIGEKVYENIWIIDMCFIAPVIFLQTIPAGEAKHNEYIRLPRFPQAITQYIVMPITAAYLVTLYTYATKILVLWQLPNGWVSYLVTAIMALMLVFIFLIYPTRHSDGPIVNLFIMRWLPIMVLPLLALMSIGVLRRLSDYGITVARLYLVLFNLWCYAVCIGLYATRSRRFGWILSSFGLVLLFSSIGPWSVAQVTKRTITSNIAQTLQQAGVNKLPLDSAQYEALEKQMPKRKKANMDSQLAYLRNNYGYSSTNQFLDSAINIVVHLNSEDVAEKTWFSQYDMLQSNTCAIPKGYTKFTILETNTLNYKQYGDSLSFVVANAGVQYHFTVSEMRLKREDGHAPSPMILKAQESALIYVDSYNLDLFKNNIMIKGLLFTK